MAYKNGKYEYLLSEVQSLRSTKEELESTVVYLGEENTEVIRMNHRLEMEYRMLSQKFADARKEYASKLASSAECKAKDESLLKTKVVLLENENAILSKTIAFYEKADMLRRKREDLSGTGKALDRVKGVEAELKMEEDGVKEVDWEVDWEVKMEDLPPSKRTGADENGGWRIARGKSRLTSRTGYDDDSSMDTPMEKNQAESALPTSGVGGSDVGGKGSTTKQPVLSEVAKLGQTQGGKKAPIMNEAVGGGSIGSKDGNEPSREALLERNSQSVVPKSGVGTNARNPCARKGIGRTWFL